ncbi:MAG: exodeoxyribonuclease VII large subunit [Lachnospiraceae bacterium]|nr:exodeoxyribonuclease VII large subunit [Lachnospiraceae bacterium]
MSAVYSVSQINSYVKTIITQDYLLGDVAVRGEVSNCKYHSSGHIFFTLKDLSSTITCVMFAGSRGNLAFRLTDGYQVIVSGTVDVYEREGKYQLYAREIKADGAGELYERFLALKDKLAEMGMFAPEYKRPLPRYISTLGIVTSPTGAVVHDIINVAKRRNPYLQILIYPAAVQGDEAAESIIAGIEALGRAKADVIIIGRGGGSIEDLWTFNEESVAQAIFDSHVPIITAIGHETDVTIADYVADLRAPTPSAAAELAVYDILVLENELSGLKRRLRQAWERQFSSIKYHVLSLEKKLIAASPQERLQDRRTQVKLLTIRLQNQIRERINNERYLINIKEQTLTGMSPQAKLGRGWAFVEEMDGRRINDIGQIKSGGQLRLYLPGGRVIAEAKEVEKTNVP